MAAKAGNDSIKARLAAFLQNMGHSNKRQNLMALFVVNY